MSLFILTKTFLLLKFLLNGAVDIADKHWVPG